jgi:hypothetical protein
LYGSVSPRDLLVGSIGEGSEHRPTAQGVTVSWPKRENGVHLHQRFLVLTMGEIGRSQNSVCLDRFVRPRCGVKNISELLFAPTRIIECARDSPLIESRDTIVPDGIAKLEPSMAVVD